MSRPLRVQYPGAWYHVMNRGLNRGNIFLNEKDYECFLKLLGESCRLYHVKTVAYCLMTNHYHLVVHTPKGNLARFLRHVNGVYTQRFNRSHRRDGPLFRGRYKAILVEADEYLKPLVRYVHLNPVEAGIVKEIGHYRWVSHHIYLKGQSQEKWIEVETVLGQFSRKKAQAIKEYRKYVEDGNETELKNFYGGKKQGWILGTEGFKNTIKEEIIESGWEEEVAEKREVEAQKVVEEILRQVGEEYDLTREELLKSRRGQENIARKMALSLAREFSRLKLNELGIIFGIKSYRTVGTNCYRVKREIERDRKLKSLYEQLRNKCSQEKT